MCHFKLIRTRTLLAFTCGWLGFGSLASAQPAGNAADIRIVGGFTQGMVASIYTEDERACAGQVGTAKPDCYRLALQDRDRAITALVQRSKDPLEAAQQVAWSAWRTRSCHSISGDGSGASATDLQCRLNFAVLREMQLMYAAYLAG